MSTEVRIRRGTTAQHAAFTGAAAEITVDTTKKTVVVHDGSTPGGSPLATEAQINALASGFYAVPGGRLSLTAAVPVTAADVTAGLNVFYLAMTSSFVPVYDGTKFVPKLIPDNLALPLNPNNAHAGYHQSGKIFDVFAYDAGSGNIGIGSGPAWSSDTSRGSGAGTTELQTVKGLLTNKNAITLRIGLNSGDTVAVPANRATYLGSFTATANGQATDSFEKRLLFNAYNQAVRPMHRRDPATNWTYSALGWRQANNNPLNKLDMLLGLSGVEVEASALAVVINSTATKRQCYLGIGVDGATDTFTGLAGVNCFDTNAGSLTASYRGFPGLGRHALWWLEYGNGNDVQTWIGTQADAVPFKTGILGSFLG